MQIILQKPANNYDILAWQRYYEARPGSRRSVGAEGDDADAEAAAAAAAAAKGAAPDIGKAVSEALAKSLGPITESIAALQSKIESRAAADDDDEDDKGGKGGGATDDEGPPDFDMMTNKELAAFFGKEMRAFGTAVAAELEKMRGSDDRTSAQIEAQKLSDKYDDFMLLREEIAAEIKGNNYLSLEQAYKLAKVNNPEKVAKVQEEVDKKKGVKSKTKEEKEEEEAMPYGGLLPTSGKSRPNQAMKPGQAAEAAWQSIFGASSSVH